MELTDYGYKIPEFDDPSTSWMDSLEDNWTRISDHDHDGVNSKKLLITSLNSAAATSGYVPKADGAGGVAWGAQDSAIDFAKLLSNLSLSVTASGGDLTVALKTKAGTNPSASDVVKVGFRSATAASGVYEVISITSSLSLAVAGAATLGSSSGTTRRVYVYLMNNSGTPVIGVSISQVPEGSLQSFSTTGTSNALIYSSSIISSKAVRLIGQFTAVNTAGSWASPTEVSVHLPQAIISDWIPVTITGNWSANTTYAARMRRVGNVMELNGSVSTTGAPTSVALSITVPNSLTIDAAILPLGIDDFPVGICRIRDAGTATYSGLVTVFTDTSIALFAQGAGATYTTMAQVTEAIPMTWANGDYLMFSARIPITEWRT